MSKLDLDKANTLEDLWEDSLGNMVDGNDNGIGSNLKYGFAYGYIAGIMNVTAASRVLSKKKYAEFIHSTIHDADKLASRITDMAKENETIH